MVNGLLQLLLFQAAGELVSKFLVSFIPGPVLGLFLLLIFLGWRGAVPQQIDAVGSAILQHLGLLFVPASVGILMFFPVLKDHAFAVMGALLLSVIATIAVTAIVLKMFSTLDSGRRLTKSSNKMKIGASVLLGDEDEEVEVHGEPDCGDLGRGRRWVTCG